MAATQFGSISDSRLRQVGGGPEPVSPQLYAARDGAAPGGPDPFFRLQFHTDGIQGDDATVFCVPLRPLGGGSPWETWAGPEPIELALDDDIRAVASADHVVVHARKAVGPDTDMTEATLAVYGGVLQRIRDLGYSNLVRIWNFVPDINGGSGDDEIYTRFNRGRAAAFDRLGLHPRQFPAATGVGCPAGAPLTVVILASRSEPLAIENPRQVSAYHYPRQYGPWPPAFARAMILPDRDGGKLYISGTASIVGHESQHRDIEAQLQETLANLDQLMETVGARLPGVAVGPRRIWRVYLRDPADLMHVEAEVARRLGGNDSVVFLQADICRRELRVEVEGVCELTTASVRSHA
ncbi:MAG: pteridine-dependent deoxygenase like protein [Gammaproteobacteria bacterium]|nr:pteridine-dependent deoxygenase like protein [Gammaproteobacteria bacterium]